MLVFKYQPILTQIIGIASQICRTVMRRGRVTKFMCTRIIVEPKNSCTGLLKVECGIGSMLVRNWVVCPFA